MSHHREHHGRDIDRCAPGCQDQLPVFSSVGRGIGGDSYDIEIVPDPDSLRETYLEGYTTDQATGERTFDWRSDNINGGYLNRPQTSFYPRGHYLSPTTNQPVYFGLMQMRFQYDRPNRWLDAEETIPASWSQRTPAIPVIWDFMDGSDEMPSFVDGTGNVWVKDDYSGINTAGNTPQTMYPWLAPFETADAPSKTQVEEWGWKEHLVYPPTGLPPGDDSGWATPISWQPWSSNLWFGLRTPSQPGTGGVKVPNLTDMEDIFNGGGESGDTTINDLANKLRMQSLLDQWPIGSVYENKSSEENPRTLMGNGEIEWPANVFVWVQETSALPTTSITTTGIPSGNKPNSLSATLTSSNIPSISSRIHLAGGSLESLLEKMVTNSPHNHQQNLGLNNLGGAVNDVLAIGPGKNADGSNDGRPLADMIRAFFNIGPRVGADFSGAATQLMVPDTNDQSYSVGEIDITGTGGITGSIDANDVNITFNGSVTDAQLKAAVIDDGPAALAPVNITGTPGGLNVKRWIRVS